MSVDTVGLLKTAVVILVMWVLHPWKPQAVVFNNQIVVVVAMYLKKALTVP